jgi:enoyl-CoA hydratase/carnithine racemase
MTTSSEFDVVDEPAALLEQRDGVARLVFNRPEKANAINADLAAQATSMLRRVAADESVRVLIVSGAGRHFCAGMDLSAAMPVGDTGNLIVRDNPVAQVCSALSQVPIPVIAAINGTASGGGCEIALCADIRIVADHAHIALPEILFGALPAAGGTQRLPRLIGAAEAKRMIWTGSPIPVERAKSLGLVDEVVPLADLVEVVDDLARALAERLRYALIAAKALVNHSVGIGPDDLAFEAAMIETMATPEQRSAAKRQAVERGGPYTKLFG